MPQAFMWSLDVVSLQAYLQLLWGWFLNVHMVVWVFLLTYSHNWKTLMYPVTSAIQTHQSSLVSWLVPYLKMPVAFLSARTDCRKRGCLWTLTLMWIL